MSSIKLTPQERRKFQRVVKQQRKEILKNSRRNRYKKTWYYSPPIYRTIGRRIVGSWSLTRQWIEFILSLIIGFIIYYLLF